MKSDPAEYGSVLLLDMKNRHFKQFVPNQVLAWLHHRRDRKVVDAVIGRKNVCGSPFSVRRFA
jgi:hypothetical protein